MESNWTYWCLVVSWVILFGQAVFWFAKYRRLYRLIHKLEEIKEKTSFSFPAYSKKDDEYRGPKTVLLSDIAIKRAVELHKATIDMQFYEDNGNVSPALFTNYPFGIKENKDEKI